MRGWLAVNGDVEALEGVGRWWIGGMGYALEGRRRHSGRLLAKLAGVESREAALALKGQPVAVPRSALPEPGEGRYYWADLVGLEVVNSEGVRLGIVKELFSNGAQDVMTLSDARRERMLPFVAAVVRNVDLDARRIEVDWGADW